MIPARAWWVKKTPATLRLMTREFILKRAIGRTMAEGEIGQKIY